MEQHRASQSPPKVGEQISQYEIREPLGAGGMGMVFLAKDRTLDRPVALKFLSDELQEDAAARRRFLREAKAAAALDHPYICKIYETGETDGRPFIAMEYVRGETLADRLAGEPLLLADALGIATEVAEALETAHGEDLVHRDLKPSNIMLTTSGHVKVLDFGLAKRVGGVEGADADAPTASELTEAGTLRGTIAYMSPEQVRGKTVDARSDIFSFGVVLYELLTGVHPFAKEAALETAAAILNQAPVPLTHHRQDLPDLLEHILGKLLAKAPADRYQLAHEVHADLVRVTEAVDQEQSHDVEPSPLLADRLAAGTLPARRLSAFGRRSLVAPAFVTVSLLTGLWVWWATLSGGTASDRQSPSVGVLPFRNVSADPFESDYLADGITRAVITKLTQVGLRVTPWETAMQFRDSAEPPAQIADALNVDTLLLGSFELVDDRILTTLSLVEAESGLQSWADEFEEPYEDLFEVPRRIAAGAATSLNLELTGTAEAVLAAAESTSVEAYDSYLQGANLLLEDNQESAEVAFEYFTRAVELDPSLAEAHVALGVVYSMRYRSGWGGGLASLDRAEASYDAALRLNALNMRARKGLTSVSWERGRSEASLLHGQEAARLGGEDVETLLAQSSGYGFAGFYDLAMPFARRVIAVDPLNLQAHYARTLQAVWTRRFPEAIEAGKAFLTLFGDDDLVHTQMALAYQMLGDDTRARESYDKATAFARQDSATPSFESIRALLHAGAFHDHAGQRQRAEAAWQQGVELLRPRLETDPGNVGVRLLLASFYGFLGDRAALWAEEEHAIETADFNSQEFLYVAASHAALGEMARAGELLSRAVRRGRLFGGEADVMLAVLAPALLESAALDEYRRESNVLERRLRERYGPSS